MYVSDLARVSILYDTEARGSQRDIVWANISNTPEHQEPDEEKDRGSQN